MSQVNIKKRKRARQYLVQALYQREINDASAIDIELHFQDEMDMNRVDREYFTTVLTDVIAKCAQLDETLIPDLDRDISELNPVELSVLRLAVYELVHRSDIPYRVVINEALDLTKLFGAEEGYRYVNGVLDAIVKKVRSDEVAPKS